MSGPGDRLPSQTVTSSEMWRHSLLDVLWWVLLALGKCLQSKCCESWFQSKLFSPPQTCYPGPDAHLWESQKLTNYYCFSQYRRELSWVGVGFRIQSHPVLFELLISGNMRGTVRYTPGDQDTANMVSVSSSWWTLHLHFLLWFWVKILVS